MEGTNLLRLAAKLILKHADHAAARVGVDDKVLMARADAKLLEGLAADFDQNPAILGQVEAYVAKEHASFADMVADAAKFTTEG